MIRCREVSAVLLSVICFACTLDVTCAAFKGASYVPDIIVNANGQGGLFFCISAAGPDRLPLPAGGRQASIQKCDATAGSPMRLTWVGRAIQPMEAKWAGTCLDVVNVTKTVSGKTTFSYQVWFKRCSGATTQQWTMDQIGYLWNNDNRYSAYVLDSAAASPTNAYVRAGDRLVMVPLKSPSAGPTQSWLYQPSSISGYTGRVYNQVAGLNYEMLCLDTNQGSQAFAVAATFAPCSAASTTQVFRTQAVAVDTGTSAGGAPLIKVLPAAPGATGFPTFPFRLQPLDGAGNVVTVNGREQCVGFSCAARSCVVSNVNGVLQLQQDNANYQIMTRDCSPFYNASLPSSVVPYPGPRDVMAINNHGDLVAYLTVVPSGNSICMANMFDMISSRFLAVQSTCSVRTITNNFFFPFQTN